MDTAVLQTAVNYGLSILILPMWQPQSASVTLQPSENKKRAVALMFQINYIFFGCDRVTISRRLAWQQFMKLEVPTIEKLQFWSHMKGEVLCTRELELSYIV